MDKFLTPAKAVEFLREQGYPLPERSASAGTHLLRLGNASLVKFVTTAGGHRRYREADLLKFLRSNSQRTGSDT